MKFCLFILSFLIAVLVLGLKPLSNPVYVTGHVRKNPKDKVAYINGLNLFVKGDGKVLGTTVTDNKGDFKLTFTPNKEKSFDFYCSGVAVDTLLIGSVIKFVSDTPEMTFYIPIQKRKNKLGQTLCPKCKRADKVYKIVYGDGMPVKMEISESGDAMYSNIYNGRYYAGTCLTGVAKYYCERDKIKF